MEEKMTQREVCELRHGKSREEAPLTPLQRASLAVIRGQANLNLDHKKKAIDWFMFALVLDPACYEVRFKLVVLFGG